MLFASEHISLFGRSRWRIRCSWTAVTLALLSWGSAAHAKKSKLPPEVGHNYAELETPRMTALGGANRASSSSLDALYSNPANMAAAKVYHVGVFGQIYPEARRQSYGGAVVDSLISSTGLSGGAGGIWSLQDPDGLDREWLDVRFGLAMPLGDIFFIGVTGKYISLQQNGTGPLGYSLASGGLPDSNILQTVTFDAGVTLRPIPEFSIGLTGNNLTNLDTGMIPIMGGLGVAFNTSDFGLTADVALESKTFGGTNFRAQGGGEVLIADHVPLRAGYRYDQGLRTHAVSGGVGYVDQKFGVDVSVRRSIAGEPYTAVVFGFKIHLESLGLGPNDPSAY